MTYSTNIILLFYCYTVTIQKNFTAPVCMVTYTFSCPTMSDCYTFLSLYRAVTIDRSSHSHHSR